MDDASVIAELLLQAKSKREASRALADAAFMMRHDEERERLRRRARELQQEAARLEAEADSRQQSMR